MNHIHRNCGATRSGQAGLSLIEIMVGLVIGLIGIVIVFQTFAVAEGYKRSTTSGGDAQQNGSLGLFYIERDARMAGYGINNTLLLGCSVRAYDEGPPTRDFTFSMAPVVITQGADGAPDTITLTFGNSDLLPAPVEITQTMPSPAAVYKVATRYGFAEGDLVIAAEAGKDCTLAQVTGLPGTPGQTDNVIHNSGTYTNAAGVNVPARYNKAGGLGVSYSAYDYTKRTGGVLYNIGALPSNNAYLLQNNQLVMVSNIQGSTPMVLADNIVQLQAQYGKDLVGNDGVVDTWEDSMPAAPSATDWTRVLAIRVAIVARSSLREKADPVSGQCTTTTASPTWSGGTIDLSADADWRCYRYRSFETTISLRNMIWRPE